MDQVFQERSTNLFNKYIDIIVALLGISLLSVWGTFARIGRTDENLCKEMDDETSSWYLSIMIMIGATFGLYGALKPKIESKSTTQNEKSSALVLLLGMHSATLAVVWVVYGQVLDFARMDNSECDEFLGQQHLFLNVAFVGLIISAMYVFYALVESRDKGSPARTVGHAFLYAGITFIFFFYASADSDETTNFWHDDTQLAWTWATSVIVFLINLYQGAGGGTSSTVEKKHIKINASNNWSRGVAFVALAVVGTNIGLAISVVQADIDHLVHNGTKGNTTINDLHANPNNSTSGCLGDNHADVLSMGITVVGYWTLYILILCVAFAQYLVQLATSGLAPACKYTIRLPYHAQLEAIFRDKYDGLNVPTVLVTVTWLWLLAGGVEHYHKINDKECGNNKDYELTMFVLHTIGFVAVLFVFPFLLHGMEVSNAPFDKFDKDEKDEGPQIPQIGEGRKRAATFLRPTNRFTTKAQVAVDVNTPLNFA